MRQFMQMNSNEWSQDKQLEMELATATASILPENIEDNTVSFISFKKSPKGHTVGNNIFILVIGNRFIG